MERTVSLTTVDNPYNPIEDFTKWFVFDTTHGYNSCSYLARITKTRNDMTNEEYNREVERAIDEIIRFDPINLYRKVVQES